MLKKILAFTMAEVLMVIAVIGVTAALALPTMTTNIDEKKVVSKLRKVYGELDTAYQAVAAQYGKPAEWKEADNDANIMTELFRDKMTEQMSISQTVGTDSLILKDGTLVTFSLKPKDDIIAGMRNSNGPCTGECGSVSVDIDGDKKGENSSHKDQFEFMFCYKEGIVPAGATATGPLPDSTAWVIQAGNMDYLKCNNLNWNTKKTCK